MKYWQFIELKILLQKMYFYILPFSSMRVHYLKKHKIFAACGENFFYQPRKIPMNPKLIKFGNNVAVAADVTFVTHDVIHLIFRQLDSDINIQYRDCIEVGNNVFIGLGAVILGGVKIHHNSIIAAGAVVTKDVPEGSIVAGVPAVPIGRFDDLFNSRRNECQKIRTTGMTLDEFFWSEFERKHRNTGV